MSFNAKNKYIGKPPETRTNLPTFAEGVFTSLTSQDVSTHAEKGRGADSFSCITNRGWQMSGKYVPKAGKAPLAIGDVVTITNGPHGITKWEVTASSEEEYFDDCGVSEYSITLLHRMGRDYGQITEV